MSSPPAYSIRVVEPHPHIPNNQQYISTGRGGAGNAIKTSSQRLTPGATASGPAAAAAIRARLSSSTTSNTTPRSSSTTSSHPSTSSTRTKYSMSGRGGAGNAFPASERAIFSFDEELERQLRWTGTGTGNDGGMAPVYHVGRGGAGNIRQGTGAFDAKPVRRMSEESAISGSSASSARSIGSTSESGADVFNRSVKRGWKKIVGVA